MATPFTHLEVKQQIAPLFSRHNSGGIYLANHSLGRPLDQTQLDINRFLELWYTSIDDAWGEWLETLSNFHNLVGDLLQLPTGGSVNLKTSAGQGLRAVLNSFAGKKLNVVTSSMEFDSIDFILRTYESQGLIQCSFFEPTGKSGSVPLFVADDFLNAITEETDLVVISVVNFTTGQLFPDIERLVNHAHQYGALVLLDTYHSFGVIPMEWPGADFAIGGSYKYVHGGPGACWLAVAPQVQNQLQTLDTGWFAKKELFGYERNADRSADERAWWESTPPVICAYQALAGLNYLNYFTIEKLRATNLHQQSELRQAFQAEGIPVFVPEDADQFGAFSLLPTANHQELVTQLKQHGIRVDSRNGFVRFGPHPLNTVEEFMDTADVLAGLLAK